MTDAQAELLCGFNLRFSKCFQGQAFVIMGEVSRVVLFHFLLLVKLQAQKAHDAEELTMSSQDKSHVPSLLPSLPPHW
jgi:hypothetical protein